jgi:hypothetical protein
VRGFSLREEDQPVSGSRTGTTCAATVAGAAVLGRLSRRLAWRIAEVAELVDETPRVKSLFLEVPD